MTEENFPQCTENMKYSLLIPGLKWFWLYNFLLKTILFNISPLVELGTPILACGVRYCGLILQRTLATFSKIQCNQVNSPYSTKKGHLKVTLLSFHAAHSMSRCPFIFLMNNLNRDKCAAIHATIVQDKSHFSFDLEDAWWCWVSMPSKNIFTKKKKKNQN